MIKVEIMHKDMNEEINLSFDLLNLNKSISGFVQNFNQKDKIVMI